MSEEQGESLPNCAKTSVLKQTDSSSSSYLTEKVVGYNWDEGINYENILKSYACSGFQARNFGLAVQETNKMIECRQLPTTKDFSLQGDDFYAVKNNCTIFLGYTSNIVSSGLRETIKFLVQHKMV